MSSIHLLTYDDEHHRFAIVASQDLAVRAADLRVGFYRAAFTDAGLNELMQTYSRLQA